jgi:hypothetical protein
LVSAARAINTPDVIRKSGFRGSRPSIQKIAAHTQIASIMTSHMTLLAEISKPGVRSVLSAASNGERVNLFARR